MVGRPRRLRPSALEEVSAAVASVPRDPVGRRRVRILATAVAAAGPPPPPAVHLLLHEAELLLETAILLQEALQLSSVVVVRHEVARPEAEQRHGGRGEAGVLGAVVATRRRRPRPRSRRGQGQHGAAGGARAQKRRLAVPSTAASAVPPPPGQRAGDPAATVCGAWQKVGVVRCVQAAASGAQITTVHNVCCQAGGGQLSGGRRRSYRRLRLRGGSAGSRRAPLGTNYPYFMVEVEDKNYQCVPNNFSG